MKLTRLRLTQLIKEELENLLEAKPGAPAWNVFFNNEWHAITLTPAEEKAVADMADLGVHEEDSVIKVLQRTRGIEVEDVESLRGL